MSGNQLQELPLVIAELTQLQYLDVRINKLKTLPPEIGQLT